MKRVSVASILTVLSAATVALAQTTPQKPADQQNQTTRGSGQSTGADGENSKFDKQALINVCISQVQVSNPNVPERDIKNFCAEQVSRLSRQN
jgi:hypothetical protein